MAKNPETVKTFLGDLGVKLQPLWEVEREKMLGMNLKHSFPILFKYLLLVSLKFTFTSASY